jgi:hypothetical protein
MTDQPEARAGTDEAIARLGKARVRVGQIVQDADAQRAVDPVGAARMVETDSDEPLDDDGNKLLRVARNGAASESTVCTEAWGADAVQAKKRTRAQTVRNGVFAALQHASLSFEDEQRQFNEETRQHREAKLELMRETADREETQAREAMKMQDARARQNQLLETIQWLRSQNPGKSTQEIQEMALEWVAFAQNA